MSYGTRIPNLTLRGELDSAIDFNRTGYSELQIQIAKGTKYIQRSDNPVATDEAGVIKTENVQSEQWRTNIQRAEGWEKTTDASMQQVLSVMQRVNELTVQANNDINATDRSTIAKEVNQIIDSLVSVGNSQYLGVGIFSGMVTGTDAFTKTVDADGNITAVTYNGGTTQRNIQTSESSSTVYGLIGEGIAGSNTGVFRNTSFENIATAGNPDDYQNVDTRLFAELINFRDWLNGGTITDPTGGNPNYDKTTNMNRLQNCLEQVISKVVENSTSQQKLKRLETSVDSGITAATNRLSDVEDLDMARAATRLNEMQVTLEASLQIAAQIGKISILNYI
ncbi:MAG: hypothetical protein A2X49_09580 [Lentisphaerae bacterium GWF2_52_8]|nr:MAG: hypothetical protein A2X49_09580 [Lentisphaerae bacterium GWF2_52_8]